MVDLPWQAQPSRQQMGGKTEKQIAKNRGARIHPRSGAGSIKDDASDDSTQYEIKDANKTYQLKGSELEVLLKRAIQRGKDAKFVIYFTANDVTVTCEVQRGKV